MLVLKVRTSQTPGIAVETIGHFILEGAPRENGKLMPRSPPSPSRAWDRFLQGGRAGGASCSWRNLELGIDDGQGCQRKIFWTTDPLLPKGLQGSSSGQVRPLVLCMGVGDGLMS